MSQDSAKPPSATDPAPQPGFDGVLQPGVRPALQIVDFVQAHLLEHSPLYARVESARLACMELLASARAAKVTVIHTNVRYQAGGRDGGVFFHKLPALHCWEEGTDPRFAEFAPGLAPGPGEIVTVLIAGVTTSGCIRATALDTCQHGFVPLIVREAVGDRAAGPHEANLFDVQAKYAEVVTLTFARRYLESLTPA